ncbi:hypothetical protein ACFZBP_29220 [Streptomyces sp. NPDC008086]|uniref:hypothetical protein n=1 Tax=Streptomyces sp. NPDC008086 TaxID=3364807 RepID=UPI0036EC6F0F
MGGVMKLGKALATGVAQERPQDHDEETELAEEIAEIAGTGTVETASAHEEVPVTR